jgi:hypothetical protein
VLVEAAESEQRLKVVGAVVLECDFVEADYWDRLVR